MNNVTRINYRNIEFVLTPEAYTTLTNEYMIDVENMAFQAIDLFLDAGIDFDRLRLYVSGGIDCGYSLNFMAL